MKLSLRATSCLLNHGVTTKEQLLNLRLEEFLSILTLGRKARQEIMDTLTTDIRRSKKDAKLCDNKE